MPDILWQIAASIGVPLIGILCGWLIVGQLDSEGKD